MTDELVRFLEARLSEEADLARRCDGDGFGEWSADGHTVDFCQVDLSGFHPTIALHVALRDPTRVLREVEAKRRILARPAPPLPPGRAPGSPRVTPAMAARKLHRARGCNQQGSDPGSPHVLIPGVQPAEALRQPLLSRPALQRAALPRAPSAPQHEPARSHRSRGHDQHSNNDHHASPSPHRYGGAVTRPALIHSVAEHTVIGKADMPQAGINYGRAAPDCARGSGAS
ncbi:DUF6221 family protein [Streptomyces venezuelae]